MAVTHEPHLITEEAQLRAIIGHPKEVVLMKIADHINEVTAAFIAASPFALIATADSDGGLDVSPRGDPAGFVRILDPRTLLLPERPGNRIADTLTNLLKDDRVALLFMIPGAGSTFRVNGRARITDDAELLGASTLEGKTPQLGILISVEEAFTQCPKALIRSDLWNRESGISEGDGLPSGGEVLRSLHPDFDATTYDSERAGRYARREGFY